MAVGSHRTKKQADSRTNHIKGKKHVCRGEVVAGLVRIHGKHPVCTDGETWYPMPTGS